MLRRLAALGAFLYPAWLLIGSTVLCLAALLANAAASQPPGRLEVRPFLILFTSAPLIEALARFPEGRTLFGAAVTLAAAALALILRHRSAGAAALTVLIPSLLLCESSLNPWERSVPGLMVSAAGLGFAQWLLLSGSAHRPWMRWLYAWLPIALTLVGLASWVFGRRGPRLAWSIAAVLAITAILPALFPPRLQPNRRIPIWVLALGLLISAALPASLTAARDRLNQQRHQATLRAIAATPDPTLGQPYPKLFFQRGISIVADREAFGSTITHSILKDLKAHGVDAIAIVVMGRAPDPDGGVESAAEIELLTRRAHQLGMKVLLKPHHTPRWSREPDLDAWFRAHEQTMDLYARLATRIHADLLSVGYEMGPAYKNEAAWRRIIARVRALYPGPLTLSPNHGEQFEGIRFWDALDYVGIDNYIPMPPGGSYASIARYFEDVHHKTGKPILFTEAGFASVDGAGREPWAEPDRALSHEEQIRCYRAVFEAVYGQPWFQGVYWWKVDTDGLGGPHDRTLTPWRKPVMNLIREWFAGPLRR